MSSSSTSPRRLVQFGVRSALIAMLAFLGVSLFGTYRELFQPSKQAPPREPPAAPTESLAREALPSGLLPAGGWTFGSQQLAMSIVDVGEPELRTKLTLTGEPVNFATRPDDAEKQVFQLLRQAELPSRHEGDCLVYRREWPEKHVIARVVTETHGSERLRLAQVAWPSGRDRWSLIELQQVRAAAPVVRRVDENQLPLPYGAVVLARRWDEQGQLVGMAVSQTPPLAELAALWRTQGWTVSYNLAQGDAQEKAICRRDGRAVEVCSLPCSKEPNGHLLLLAHLPNNSSTAPERSQ